MLTGIQDAHNLAWKLAEAVKQQRKEPMHLLQSYEAERKPVAIVGPLSQYYLAKKFVHINQHELAQASDSLEAYAQSTSQSCSVYRRCDPANAG